MFSFEDSFNFKAQMLYTPIFKVKIFHSSNFSNNYVIIVSPIQQLNEDGYKNKDNKLEYAFSIISIIELKIIVNLSFKACIIILDISIEYFEKSLTDSVIVSIDTMVIKGYLRFYKKDENVCLDYSLKVFKAPAV
ncbi:14269_t:CDS:1 [Funneliformis caledonium]|uniref:14269_t:CDS:1 n=1 Tax=Funneliformis caledonium TaxID=1117310 RepID=A0A9N9I6V3_9GLOM|nr:14269_t:CDS:1 [Funneliformis caledonium]